MRCETLPALWLAAALALPGCGATRLYEGAPPEASERVDLEVQPHVRSMTIDGRRSLADRFESRAGVHRIEVTVARTLRPTGIRGTEYRSVYECTADLQLDGGTAYRLVSHPAEWQGVEATSNGSGIRTSSRWTYHSVIVEVHVLPEADAIARVPCGEPRTYEVPPAYINSLLIR